MKRFIYLLLPALLSHLSCDQKQDEAYTQIDVEINDAQTIAASEWFSSIEITLLEANSESLLKACDKIVLFDNRYYVLDKGQQTIFVFDRTGKFICSSRTMIGQGPGEYVYIDDFCIDKDNNTIELLDTPGYTVRVYSLDFTPLDGSWRLAQDLLPVWSFQKLSADNYAFYRNPTERFPHLIQIYSVQEEKIVEKIDIPYPYWEVPWTLEKNYFYEYRSEYFFSLAFPNPDLYKLNTKDFSVEKVLECNFGKETFGANAIEGISEDFFTRPGRYVLATNKYQNDKFFFVYLYAKNGSAFLPYMLRYEKETGRQNLISAFFSDKTNLSVPYFIDNEYFYSLSESTQAHQHVVRELLDEKSKQVLDNLTDDDNPVIIKYKLRD